MLLLRRSGLSTRAGRLPAAVPGFSEQAGELSKPGTRRILGNARGGGGSQNAGFLQ